MKLKRVYIAGLDSSETDETLTKLFDKYGEVVHAYIAKPCNEENLGYGFIKMYARHAQNAIDSLHGTIRNNHVLKVVLASDNKKKDGKKDGDDDDGGDDDGEDLRPKLSVIKRTKEPEPPTRSKSPIRSRTHREPSPVRGREAVRPRGRSRSREAARRSRSPPPRRSRSPPRRSRSPPRRSRSPPRRSRSPPRRSRSPPRPRERSPPRPRERSPVRARDSQYRERSRDARPRSRSPMYRGRSRSPNKQVYRDRSLSPRPQFRDRSPPVGYNDYSRTSMEHHNVMSSQQRSRSPVRQFDLSQQYRESSPRSQFRERVPLEYSRLPMEPEFRRSRSPVMERSRTHDRRPSPSRQRAFSPPPPPPPSMPMPSSASVPVAIAGPSGTQIVSMVPGPDPIDPRRTFVSASGQPFHIPATYPSMVPPMAPPMAPAPQKNIDPYEIETLIARQRVLASRTSPLVSN